MARSRATPNITEETSELRNAAATLKSARLTARASKARLQALKGEVKIQKQHYKWARKQVRVAKDALADWRTAATETDVAETESPGPAPAPATKRAKATGGESKKRKAGPAKREALAIKRLILSPVAPASGPSAGPAQSAVNPPNQPSPAERKPASVPGGATSRVE